MAGILDLPPGGKLPPPPTYLVDGKEVPGIWIDVSEGCDDYLGNRKHLMVMHPDGSIVQCDWAAAASSFPEGPEFIE